MTVVAHYSSSQSVTLDDDDDKLQLVVRRMDSLRVDFQVQVDAHRDSRVGATVSDRDQPLGMPRPSSALKHLSPLPPVNDQGLSQLALPGFLIQASTTCHAHRSLSRVTGIPLYRSRPCKLFTAVCSPGTFLSRATILRTSKSGVTQAQTLMHLTVDSLC